MVGGAWRTNRERVRPFFAFPHEVRKLIYTTNAIESLNSTLRKVVRVRGHFPNDVGALYAFRPGLSGDLPLSSRVYVAANGTKQIVRYVP